MRERRADARNKGGILAPSVTRKVTRVSRVSLHGLGKKERLLIKSRVDLSPDKFSLMPVFT